MANQDTRKTRDNETREFTGYVYAPASTLPQPNPMPGWRFRYLAYEVNGQSNHTHMAQMRREHWEPVKAADHPELQVEPNAKGEIEIGGLILCKAPEEVVNARKAYYDRQANNQMESVDNHFMRNNDARMPLFSERKSSTTKGGGFGNGSK